MCYGRYVIVPRRIQKSRSSSIVPDWFVIIAGRFDGRTSIRPL